MKCDSYVKNKQKYQWYMGMYCAVQILLTTMNKKNVDDSHGIAWTSFLGR